MLNELSQNPELIYKVKEIIEVALLSISCLGAIGGAVGAAIYGVGFLTIPDANEAHEQMWEDFQNDRS